MNTLQLYISKSARESGKLAEINPSDDGRRAVADMKAAVALIDYPPSTKNIFLIAVNHPGGYAIHIIRTIPPVKPNHLDATIFVDKDIDIMTEDLLEVIDSVSQTILAKAVTEDDMARLRKLFSREYDTRDKSPRIKPSRGNDYAFISYGGQSPLTLDEILSDDIYRRKWSDFKAVCLLDDLLPLPNSMTDLTPGDDIPSEPDDISTPAPQSDLEQTAQPLTYVFSIPVLMPEGRSDLEFELECSNPMQRSPIEGYATSGRIVPGTERINRLRRADDSTLYSRFEKWIWGAGGIVCGIIIMAIAGLFKDSPSERPAASVPVEVISDSAPAQPVSETDASAKAPADIPAATPKPQTSEATAYLDNNKIWVLEDMEKIEGLRGLFDDINNYRFDQLSGPWAETLAASKSFAKVAKAAHEALSKKVDPRRSPEHSPTYNREGDTKIGWVGYTFWIDP